MRKWTERAARLGVASIIGAAFAAPQAAAAQAPPVLTRPVIDGAPVVGETLTASVVAVGDPAPELSYEWLRCPPANMSCDAIPGATEEAYVVDAADLGWRLAVRARAVNSEGEAEERSEPTGVVTAAPEPEPTPEPEPSPTPTPSPSPQPPSDDEADDDEAPRVFEQSGPSSGGTVTPTAGTSRPAYLQPFPVVRIAGRLVRGGADITRLAIRAPARARVVVRCARRGCDFYRRTSGSRRIRALERFLRAGTRITISVTRPGRVGKHVRIVIRDGRRPWRRDSCLLPDGTGPEPCPAP